MQMIFFSYFNFNKQNIKSVNYFYQHDHKRKFDCFRYVIKNIFLALKLWRAIAVHYAKTLDIPSTLFLFVVFLCYFDFI